ncbi:ABC transporter substrate-binding protein [Xanthobacter sp. KR7-65]|uniref:ABC transporter substrate-binding protein n=1 Tax=Xanthobacter sp. KR7-65 TaxID=3156612 RepID=UPI0032B4A452
MAQAPAKPAEKAPDKAVLMLNWYVYGEHAPFVLGLKKGYYKEEGIDLEIQEGRGSAVTIQAVGAGTATFGLADIGVMIKAAAKGAPVKTVGVLLQRTPGAVVAPEGKINGPKDLVGKTIMFTPGDAVTPIWPLYLKKLGIADGQVKMVAGDAQTKLNAVVNGQADGLIGFTTEQGARLPDIMNKPVTMLRYADAGVSLVSLGIVANQDTLKTRADMVKRFMRATTRAVEDAERDPKAAVAILLEAYPKIGLPDAQLRSLQYSQALYRSADDPGARPFRMKTAVMDETLDILTQYGGLEPSQRGKADDYFTLEFLP